jgi:hypothetical protein
MKIIVDSEELKREILKQSKYIHDFLEVVDGKWIGLDSDKAGILMHLYLNEDMILVKNENKT